MLDIKKELIPTCNDDMKKLEKLLKGNNDYDLLSDFVLISYQSNRGPIKVDTTYMNGYGCFTWYIPDSLFPMFNGKSNEKVSESFEIKFLCEKIRKQPFNDIHSDLDFYLKFKTNDPFFRTEVIDISFKVSEKSNLTYNNLVSMLHEDFEMLGYGIRKDFLDIPSKSDRIESNWL